MNYCFGHPESSMIFFPVGAVASYINHGSSKEKVNAKMVWSDHPNNHKDWLYEELQPFNAMGGLVLEIVATKDIKEGEEGKRTAESILFTIYIRRHITKQATCIIICL